MMSGRINHKLVGVAIFVLIFLSTFHIWNLVLGVFVRQFVIHSDEEAVDAEHQKVCQEYQRLQQLSVLLEDAVVDKEGFISHSALTETLTGKREKMNEIGLEIKQLA